MKTFKKEYFDGKILVNNEVKNIRLHRYIMNVINSNYSKFVIDHLDGNGLNNKKENLVITDDIGNKINIFKKGYFKDKDNVYVCPINYRNKSKAKRFNCEQSAKEYYLKYKQILMDCHLQWKTKEELDVWLENIKRQGSTIDKAIEQHYDELYKKLKILLWV